MSFTGSMVVFDRKKVKDILNYNGKEFLKFCFENASVVRNKKRDYRRFFGSYKDLSFLFFYDEDYAKFRSKFRFEDTELLIDEKNLNTDFKKIDNERIQEFLNKKIIDTIFSTRMRMSSFFENLDLFFPKIARVLSISSTIEYVDYYFGYDHDFSTFQKQLSYLLENETTISDEDWEGYYLLFVDKKNSIKLIKHLKEVISNKKKIDKAFKDYIIYYERWLPEQYDINMKKDKELFDQEKKWFVEDLTKIIKSFEKCELKNKWLAIARTY